MSDPRFNTNPTKKTEKIIGYMQKCFGTEMSKKLDEPGAKINKKSGEFGAKIRRIGIKNKAV